MRKLFLSLLLCCLAAISGHVQNVTVTDITVETEGQLGYKVLEMYNAFDEVKGLRISGPINEEDWKTLKEMPSLKELYMDDAIVLNEAVPKKQFSDHNRLRIVTLPYSCKTIGNSAFSSCDKLQSISLPNVESIEREAFSSCDKLQSISLPNVVSIERYAFANCTSLTSINLSDKLTMLGDGCFMS